MCVCVCICVYICILYMYMYMFMYVYMYVYVCMYMYVYVCMYVCVCIYICVNVCMCVYTYIYIYVCACVCMWTHVDVCEGPYHSLRFGRRGCCFYKSENTESDWYTSSPYGLVDLQLLHSSDRGYHIPLSVSVTVVYPPQVVLSCTPTLRTYC